MLAHAAKDGTAPTGWYHGVINQTTFPDANPNGSNRGWNFGAIGYPWNTMACFKHAFLMHAFAESGILKDRKFVSRVVQTNGSGGGNWSSPKTWKNGRVPKQDARVLVAPGDILRFDGNSQQEVCAGLTVSEGAQLLFARGKHVLSLRGNVVVEKGGLLKMGPNSALRIYSRVDIPHGITVRGRLHARGTSRGKRNCLLEAMVEYPGCETFLHFEGESPQASMLRFCTLHRVNVTVEDTYLPLIDGNYFYRCSIRYKYSGNKPAPTTQQFINNDVAESALSLENVNGITVAWNRFHDGGKAIS